MQKVGIIIPAQNEELLIAQCLTSLQSFQSHGDVIIVVDAQSTDQTVLVAKSYKIQVISGKKSERGYAAAEGIDYLSNNFPECEYVIIAHADMLFQPNACEVFHQAIQSKPDTVWGSFGHSIQSKRIGFKIIEIGNNIRAHFYRYPYGDQAQFFRINVLKKIGFPNQEKYEDLELCYRFQNEPRYLYLNNPVMIPNRHWKQGIIRTTLQNWKTIYQYRKNRINANFTYNQ